jgi:hypothetical protein
MYFGVTFDRSVTWMLHIERTVAKALRTCVRTYTYTLFKRERLSTNIKHMLYTALIRPLMIMIYACPTWEHAADSHLLKLQRLGNRVLSTIGNLDRPTLVREMHVAFKIP